jgi:two-component system, OmpR family, response regulator
MSNNPSTRVLLCEDDPNLGRLLTEYLNAKGFQTTLAVNGAEGIKAFKHQSFDLILLDVMMPEKDGFTTAAELRTMDRHIPILFITAKSLEEDVLKGFKAGADDYITKPFSMEVLLARIEVIMKRSAPFPEPDAENVKFEVGQYAYDYHKQELKHNSGEETRLTTKENELLYLLCKHKNDILERNFALKAIWGDDNYFNGRSMDVYVAKLRKHLSRDPKVQILNVHGKGFKLLDS